MSGVLIRLFLGLVAGVLLAGCASRPINPPIDRVDLRSGYRYESRLAPSGNRADTLVVLAFSGGGTRAAAFSYGVLEELRRTQVTIDGKPTRLIDQVDAFRGAASPRSHMASTARSCSTTTKGAF
jgi:NTE family protein